MILHLENSQDFEKEIQGDLVLVDFYADWCGPCKMLAPELEALEKETGLKIIKINVDELGDIARKFRIMTIPTLMLFKGGELVKRESTYMPLEALKQFIA